MKVKIQIGDRIEHVDMDTQSLSLREAVRVQETIGSDEWDQVTQGRIRPAAFQAIILAKLRSKYPDVTVDDFDMPYLVPPSESVEDDEEPPTEAS